MTDNDIIKALEICIGFVSGGEAMCNNCPLHDCDNCSSEKLKQALNLINRQQAEIEKLEKAGNEAVSCFNRMETLYKIKCKELEVVKTEAIKEFAEKLKAYFEDEFIDNLVKEMTEVKQ